MSNIVSTLQDEIVEERILGIVGRGKGRCGEGIFALLYCQNSRELKVFMWSREPILGPPQQDGAHLVERVTTEVLFVSVFLSFFFV